MNCFLNFLYIVKKMYFFGMCVHCSFTNFKSCTSLYLDQKIDVLRNSCTIVLLSDHVSSCNCILKFTLSLRLLYMYNHNEYQVERNSFMKTSYLKKHILKLATYTSPPVYSDLCL